MRQSRNVNRNVRQGVITGLALCSLFVFAAQAFSWDSVMYDNHRELTDYAAK